MASESVKDPVRIKHPKLKDREPAVVPRSSVKHWQKLGWQPVTSATDKKD